MAGSCVTPTPATSGRIDSASFMGQGLLRPPGVEGWHEGDEWIDSGALVERVNFVSREIRDVDQPGVRAIIDRLAGQDGGTLSPGELVDGCLDLMGPVEVAEATRSGLTEYVAKKGPVELRGHQPGDHSESRVGELLGLNASTREFQLA